MRREAYSKRPSTLMAEAGGRHGGGYELRTRKSLPTSPTSGSMFLFCSSAAGVAVLGFILGFSGG